MESELMLRNKFLTYTNRPATVIPKHIDTTDNTWILSNKRIYEHQENTDHTVPSREIMEARERRMRQAQNHMMNINAIEVPCVKEELPKDLYMVDGNKILSYDNYGIAIKHEPVDNLSGYTVPVDRTDDICVEEILVGLGDASDGWYHPSPYHYERPNKRFLDVRVPSQDEISPPPSPYYAYSSSVPSLASVPTYSRQPLVAYNHRNDHNSVGLVPAHKRRKVSPPGSPEDEPRLVESSDEKENMYFEDELELDSQRRRKKMQRAQHAHVPNVPGLAAEASTYEEVGGVCGKTNKPRQRKEYFYSKNSKTIFRWTCCGSQAKDHPEF